MFRRAITLCILLTMVSVGHAGDRAPVLILWNDASDAYYPHTAPSGSKALGAPDMRLAETLLKAVKRFDAEAAELDLRVETVYEGYFTTADQPEMLVFLHLFGPYHMQGFDAHYAAVTDATGERVLSLHSFGDDEFSYELFTGEDGRTRLAHVGLWSGSGITHYSFALYDLTDWTPLMEVDRGAAMVEEGESELRTQFTPNGEIRVDAMDYCPLVPPFDSFAPLAQYAFEPATGTMREVPVPMADRYITWESGYPPFSLQLPMTWFGRYRVDGVAKDDCMLETIWRFWAVEGGQEIFSLAVLPAQAEPPHGATLIGHAENLYYPDFPKDWPVYLQVPTADAGEEVARMRADIPAIMASFSLYIEPISTRVEADER